MSKLVASEFVTVDGVFEDPGGAEDFEYGGWAFQFDRGPEGDKFKLDELVAAGALLLGRVTYQGFAEAWPMREGTGEFAEKMNSIPKYVVSSTLRDPEWNNSTVIGIDRVAELKHEVEGDILIAGSGELVRALTDLQLVDELRLMVFPVVLGRGKRLFDRLDESAPLRLVGTQQARETLILTYAPDSGRSLPQNRASA
jgi:dihydrofolate reductase